MVSAKQEWFEDIETLDPGPAEQRQSDIADIGNIWVATLAGKHRINIYAGKQLLIKCF